MPDMVYNPVKAANHERGLTLKVQEGIRYVQSFSHQSPPSHCSPDSRMPFPQPAYTYMVAVHCADRLQDAELLTCNIQV
jgi:hypothetical protein